MNAISNTQIHNIKLTPCSTILLEINLTVSDSSVMTISCKKEIGLSGMDWIHLAQDRGQWNIVVNTVMNLLVP
jgi:hypothetical protein